MPCKSCGSENLREFSGKMAIHFPGLKNIAKPHVPLSSGVVVCFTCGTAEFDVPDVKLRLLQKGSAAVAGSRAHPNSNGERGG
jgi:hypothetical protein